MKANPSQSLLILVLLLVTCGTADAQSGRRGSGKPTTTTPSASGEKEVEAKPQKAARLRLFVGIDPGGAFSNTPYYLADTVLDECMRRLGEAADVLVTPGGRLTRGEAAKAAKAEKESYVVWLQLGNDLAGTSSSNGPTELWVNYALLEPGTAKTKHMGRTYHSIYKAGNTGVSGPTSRQSPIYSEYAVKQAAREAADKILEALDIKIGERSR